MSDRWLSVEEIAEHLGVSRDTVYTWVNEKGLPAHKVGKLWKFRLAQVDKWVESGRSSQSTAKKSRSLRTSVGAS